MRTVVFPPPSGIGRTRTVDVAFRPITDEAAFAIALTLAQRDLWVLPEIEHRILNLHPMRPTTAAGERDIIAAFEDVTDMRVAWRGRPEPVKPSCLLCGRTGLVLEHDLCGRCGRPFQPAPVWGVA
jgi:hypothetical protein